MAKEFSRSERVADAVRRELANLIRQEVRDPRLDLVNITGVDVSRDLSVAKVYVNFITEPDETELVTRLAALNKAAGFLRSQLARRVVMRATPELRFYYDETGRRGTHLSALIDFAVAQDQQRRRGPSEDS